MGLTTYFFVFLALVGVVAALIFFVGVPAEWKDNLQRMLVQRAAEGEARDMLHDQLSKLPEADRKNVEGLCSGIEQLTGGRANVKNPLGGLMGGKDD